MNAAPYFARAVIIGAVFIASISLGFAMPLLALSLNGQGLSALMIGLNAMSPAIGIVLISPFMGRLVQFVGVRVCALLSTLLFICFILLLPVWSGFWPWLFIRFFIGAATGTFWINAEAWLNAVTPATERGRSIGAYTALSALGLGLGPLLVALTGTDTITPFLIVAALFATATAVLLFSRTAEVTIASTRSVSFGAAILMAPTVMTASFVSGFVAFAQIVLLPIVIAREGLSVATGAAALSTVLLGAVVLRMALVWVADRRTRRSLLFRALLLCSVANLLLLVIGPGSVLYWVILFLWGGGVAALYSIALIMAGDQFEAESLAASSAALRAAYHCGNITGPAIAGLAMDIVGPDGLMLASLASILLLFISEVWRSLALRRCSLRRVGEARS